VKPAAFEYVRAESVDHAVEILREHGDEAKVLAGGQSLVPALNMRLARPRVLVDLNRVGGLDGIETENGSLRVGALVRQAAALRDPLVRAACPPLADALPFVGHSATRNRGTVGGSIAHADAAAELPVSLVAAGGSVVTSRRTIPADDFFVSHYMTALEPDEVVVATMWPRLGDGEGFAFEEFALRHGDFALATVACMAGADGARVAIGAVTDRPLLLETSDPEEAAAAVDPPPNLHASPEYRRRLVALLVERAVARARDRLT
jgi:CO/xanthine dehydrogenase FAD-binding subunit